MGELLVTLTACKGDLYEHIDGKWMQVGPSKTLQVGERAELSTQFWEFIVDLGPYGACLRCDDVDHFIAVGENEEFNNRVSVVVTSDNITESETWFNGLM